MKSPTTYKITEESFPIDDQNITETIETKLKGLFSLDDEVQKNIWQLFQKCIASGFGIDYISKLNLLVENKTIANNKVNRKEFSNWFNQEAMAMIDHLIENELYDDPKTLSVLCEIILELKASMDCIEKDNINQEMDYVLDLPYRAMDIISSSPDIPKLHIQEFKSETQHFRITSSHQKVKITGLIAGNQNHELRSNIKWILK
jgi:hypothetical protein